MGNLGFAAVISPISVADKAESDDFGIRPGLDLTYDLFKENIQIPPKSRRESSIADSPTSQRPLVRELGMGGRICPAPAPQWGDFGGIPQGEADQ